MIKLKIVKNLEAGEYIIKWYEDGKFKEGPTCYCGGLSSDDQKDAVYTAVSMIQTARKNGKQAEFNDDKYTINLVSKYRSDFLVNEARNVAQEYFVDSHGVAHRSMEDY